MEEGQMPTPSFSYVVGNKSSEERSLKTTRECITHDCDLVEFLVELGEWTHSNGNRIWEEEVVSLRVFATNPWSTWPAHSATKHGNRCMKSCHCIFWNSSGLRVIERCLKILQAAADEMKSSGGKVYSLPNTGIAVRNHPRQDPLLLQYIKRMDICCVFARAIFFFICRTR